VVNGGAACQKLNGGAWVVGNAGISPSQEIEDDTLSYIRVTDKDEAGERDGELSPFKSPSSPVLMGHSLFLLLDINGFSALDDNFCNSRGPEECGLRGGSCMTGKPRPDSFPPSGSGTRLSLHS